MLANLENLMPPDKMQTVGVQEARTQFSSILRTANRDGVVTVITKRGVPYAAVAPAPRRQAKGPALSSLRGSAKGCFGDAARYITRLRNEW